MASMLFPIRASSVIFKISSSLIRLIIFSPRISLLDLKISLAESFTAKRFLFSSTITRDSLMFFRIVLIVSLSLSISL